MAELPVSVRVVRPSLALSPAAVDFGEVSPGQAVERQLTLSLDGLKPREATLTASPLVGPANAPPVPVPAVAGVKLLPGEPAAVRVTLRVPYVQPPGDYRGELLVKTSLGEQRVACTAKVAAANTFQAVATVDFGEVAIGATKEAAVEVGSLVDAEQKVELALPSPLPGCQVVAEPASVTLAPHGKASVTFRLTALAAAKPGPRSATAVFRGPSRGASVELRATLFRPPHESIAFEPADINVGRLKAGVDERLSVRVRSLVDETQHVAFDDPNAPAGVIGVSVAPRGLTLAASASQPVELTLRPVSGPDDTPFVATVTARGRSLPATLRVRGTVYTPLRDSFALAEPVLDFGPMSPGQHAELALAIQSLHHREQKVSLANPPPADGITLAAERYGTMLLPGVIHPVGIDLAVAPDASPGERRVTWEIRGQGRSATFEVRVEVVPPPPPPPAVAAMRPRGIGWQEGV
ncbi:MAG: hypothetical protein NTU94_15635, partial [Planctomycetota bacterium]|nr:hypothetical protein [Planctomycetota bacterium]